MPWQSYTPFIFKKILAYCGGDDEGDYQALGPCMAAMKNK